MDAETRGRGVIQLAAVLSSHRASRHTATPSLGHYASLSFIVIGRGQRQKKEDRRQKFYCGSGFPRPACPGRGPGEPACPELACPELACPELVEWVEWVERVEGQPRLEQLLRL